MSFDTNEKRWQVPVGAVAVHVCIGSVYAWSTFNRPIQQLLPEAPWWQSPPYGTFTTALALLGLSAAHGDADEFPVLFTQPVSRAAWLGGKAAALAARFCLRGRQPI